MEEIWKTIDVAPNYEVSSFGNIRRKDGKVISQWQLNNGYMQTQFNTRKKYQVHRLVAHAFKPEGEFTGAVINHIDNDRENNHYTNLEWCDQSHNIKHAYKQGRMSKKGERHHLTNLTNEIVLEIRRKRISGSSYTELSSEFGVKQGTIKAICIRANWKHI